MKQLLSPKQVARAIGASEASLKRWCDKGLIAAVRTAGGHRRLPIDAVLKFIRESGQPLVAPEVLGLPATSGRGEGCVERCRQRMLDALESGDAETLRAAAFDVYLSGQTVCFICDQLLASCFATLGSKWSHGQLHIYQERRGIEICTQWLYEIRAALPTPEGGAPYALGGTLASDPYTLPTAMAEAVLREAGWRAESFGIGHPLETLRAAVEQKRPRLVWVSFSVVRADAKFHAEWEEFHAAARGVGAAVVIGGRGLTDEFRRGLSYTVFCDRLSNLVEFARSVQS